MSDNVGLSLEFSLYSQLADAVITIANAYALFDRHHLPRCFNVYNIVLQIDYLAMEDRLVTKTKFITHDLSIFFTEKNIQEYVYVIIIRFCT